MPGMLDRGRGVDRAKDLAGSLGTTPTPATSVSPAATPATGCDTPPAGATAAKTVAPGRTFLGIVNQVIDRSGVKRQALAIDAGYSEFQFSRITSGQSGALDFPDRLPYQERKQIARAYAETFPELVVAERATDELIARTVEELRRATSAAVELIAAHELAKDRRR